MINDVWVNWTVNETNPHLVPQWFEWKQEDEVILLDAVPMIVGEEKVLDYIEYGLNSIPTDLLVHVYGKTYIRKNHERIMLPHCFIITDKKRVIVVNVDDSLHIDKKSRLIPRHENLVLEYAKGQSPQWELKGAVDTTKYERFIGKTRSEKELLVKVREFILTTDNTDMLKYLLVEWDHTLFGKLKGLTFEEVKEIALHKLTESTGDLQHVIKVIEGLKQIN